MYWFALIIAGIASAFFLNGLWSLWNGKRSLHWPAAKGVVKACRVELKSEPPTDGNSVDSYEAIIRYEFTVSGNLISATRISFMPLAASLKDAKAIADRYRVGKHVKVYHHPTRPSLCTLERGTEAFAWVVVGLAGLVLIFLLGIPAGYVTFTPSTPSPN